MRLSRRLRFSSFVRCFPVANSVGKRYASPAGAGSPVFDFCRKVEGP
jgi:hypothetical protein